MPIKPDTKWLKNLESLAKELPSKPNAAWWGKLKALAKESLSVKTTKELLTTFSLGKINLSDDYKTFLRNCPTISDEKRALNIFVSMSDREAVVKKQQLSFRLLEDDIKKLKLVLERLSEEKESERKKKYIQKINEMVLKAQEAMKDKKPLIGNKETWLEMLQRLMLEYHQRLDELTRPIFKKYEEEIGKIMEAMLNQAPLFKEACKKAGTNLDDEGFVERFKKAMSCDAREELLGDEHTQRARQERHEKIREKTPESALIKLKDFFNERADEIMEVLDRLIDGNVISDEMVEYAHKEKFKIEGHGKQSLGQHVLNEKDRMKPEIIAAKKQADSELRLKIANAQQKIKGVEGYSENTVRGLNIFVEAIVPKKVNIRLVVDAATVTEKAVSQESRENSEKEIKDIDKTSNQQNIHEEMEAGLVNIEEKAFLEEGQLESEYDIEDEDDDEDEDDLNMGI